MNEENTDADLMSQLDDVLVEDEFDGLCSHEGRFYLDGDKENLKLEVPQLNKALLTDCVGPVIAFLNVIHLETWVPYPDKVSIIVVEYYDEFTDENVLVDIPADLVHGFAIVTKKDGVHKVRRWQIGHPVEN